MNSGGNRRWVPLIIRTLILNFVDNKILIKNKSNDLHILNVFKRLNPFSYQLNSKVMVQFVV